MFYEAENGKVWMTYPGSRILNRGFARLKEKCDNQKVLEIGDIESFSNL